MIKITNFIKKKEAKVSQNTFLKLETWNENCLKIQYLSIQDLNIIIV